MDTEKDNQAPRWIESDAWMDFIDELRESGYKIGVSQYIATQTLLARLIARGETLEEPERLGTLLGPIFCSSPTEQEDFRRRWIGFLDRLETGTDRPREKSVSERNAQALSKEFEDIRSGSRNLTRWIVLSAIGLITVLVPLLVKPYFQPDPRTKPAPAPEKPAPAPEKPAPEKPAPATPAPAPEKPAPEKGLAIK